MTTLIPILVYHSVSDDPPRGCAWGAVSRAAFARQLDAIAFSGREALTITELADGLRGERPLPERPLGVTFDDGYGDTYRAVEELGRRELAATVYVTTGAIGAPGRVTAEQILALAQLPGVEIGAHAVRHVRLDELRDHELYDELRGSRTQLEALIGDRVCSFAYPHGAHDGRVRGAVIESGYRSAAAVKNAVSHLADDPFAIARWIVMGRTAPGRVADVLEGRGVPLASNCERWRTRGYRIVRRQRHRLLSARA